MNQIKLEEKEERFCQFYRETGNGRKAALLAGYPAPDAEREALLLLADRRIQRRLDKLRKTGREKREEIAAGLRRIAFGPVGDAVRLAVFGRNLTEEELEQLDLFNLAELKVGEKGIEMKFYDRQKALVLLQGLEAENTAEKSSSFYDALEQGAAVLRKEAGTGE